VSAQKVLLVGSSFQQDHSVPAVRQALTRLGAQVLFLDSAQLPVGVDLSWGEDPAASRLRTPDFDVAMGDLDAVWLRHTHVAAGVWELMDPAYAPAIKAQTVSGLWDLLGCLDHLRQVDRIAALQALPGQVGMLRLARACGLAVPRTLVSNDVDRVAAFLDGLGGPAIRKMIDSSASKVPGPDGPIYLPTQRVSAQDRANLARVAMCPMVFQEEVEKVRELRITVVGDQLFTGAVDPRGSAKGAVDWRQDPTLVGAFTAWDLDPDVAAAVRRLMTRLGLEFGTVDIIVKPDGEHVFLEVNTISFFDFLEEATGLPISGAVAELLAGLRPGRLPAGR
jgi:hypothetical protein